MFKIQGILVVSFLDFSLSFVNQISTYIFIILLLLFYLLKPLVYIAQIEKYLFKLHYFFLVILILQKLCDVIYYYVRYQGCICFTLYSTLLHAYNYIQYARYLTVYSTNI